VPRKVPGRPPFALREGVALSVSALAAGGFAVVGASANAPLIRADLGLSEVGVGAIASVAYLGAMLTARPAGRATDRFGPTVVLATGLLVMAAGVTVVATAPVTAVFFVGIAVAGTGYGIINPPTNVLANPGRAQRRGLVMSVKQAGVPLGGILAGALLPALGSVYGWRWAAVVPLATCVLAGLLVAVRGRLRSASVGDGTALLRPDVRMRLPHGYGYGFVMAGAQVSIFAFTTVYLVEQRGLTAAEAGLGVALLLVGGVCGRPLWGWFSDLRPELRLRHLQVVSVLGAVAVTLLWVVSAGLLPVALLVVGLCAVGWNGVYVAAVAEAAEPGQVGGTTGASLVLINLGAVACPLLIGFVVSLAGRWSIGWIVCAALNLAGAAIVAASRAVPAQAGPSTGSARSPEPAEETEETEEMQP
jgi:MFS family permease